MEDLAILPDGDLTEVSFLHSIVTARMALELAFSTDRDNGCHFIRGTKA
jgi:hypothetical protein